MLAGGVAGGLFGIGWGILGVVGMFAVVVVALGFVFGTLLGEDFTGGFGVIIVVLLLVGLAVGIVLVILSVVLSQRILRRGQREPPYRGDLALAPDRARDQHDRAADRRSRHQLVRRRLSRYPRGRVSW